MISLKDGLYTYKGDDFIGAGGYGLIFEGRNTQTEERVAIKMIKKQKANESYLRVYFFQALEREVKIQRELTETKIPFFV